MEEYLIVDGYNIIGDWPELQRLKDVNLEEARDKLIDMLADYQAFTGKKVYIVFDAHQVPGLGVKYEQSKMKILFTKEKETADELIERLVVELTGRRRRIYVATSDLLEQRVTFAIGALRIPARELLVNVKQNQKELSQKIRENTDTKRNTFDSNLSGELRNIFEKWRRGQ